ncbi:Ig-like domain-containing protein [Arenibacter echinorum]|uniref:Uncharacterized protein DUF1573 n=1 Tax=Arenibacter echinorum TaxID=440515 RepID=A0A327RCA0_9FLAO|nr:DUF1573 domain-containing protein [Arenibacter echinorum]RAJ13808.1 uncharacterized protein DUF1573 [Arenibacter echinorum]
MQTNPTHKAMKFRNQILILIYIIIFSGCSSDDKDAPIENEPETEIEQTAIINLTSEESNEIDFGDVVTNIIATRVFSIQNSGNSDLNITNIILPDNYTIDSTSGIIPSNSSKQFTVTFIPTEIADYSNSITIESNATSGSNVTPIIGFGVSSVYEGSVTLITQEEVEDFAKLGYTEITVALFIGNINNFSKITSLASLNKLTDVGSLQVISTRALEDLSGLENLNVSHSIQLLSNSALKNVDALLGVTKLSDYLSFLSNSALTQIDGLSNITEVGDNLRIKNHPLLTNLDGLSNVTIIKKDLIVEENPLIENLNSLSTLQNVSSVRFQDNSSLYDYCGIKELLLNGGVSGTFYNTSYNRYNPTQYEIIYNDCLKEIPEGVYDGSVLIRGATSLNKFASKEYHTVDGNFSINDSFYEDEHRDISTLEGLNNLRTINGTFSIRKTILINLSGLENLLSAKQIVFEENTDLANYCALNSFIQNGTLGENYNGIPGEEYLCVDNFYNPTIADLQNGQCTE